MSVHKDLAKHAEKQNTLYREFLQLDQLREAYIEEAVELCKAGKDFSVDNINMVTKQMNQINLRIVPHRKLVTTEMIKEYVEKIKL